MENEQPQKGCFITPAGWLITAATAGLIGFLVYDARKAPEPKAQQEQAPYRQANKDAPIVAPPGTILFYNKQAQRLQYIKGEDVLGDKSLDSIIRTIELPIAELKSVHAINNEAVPVIMYKSSEGVNSICAIDLVSGNVRTWYSDKGRTPLADFRTKTNNDPSKGELRDYELLFIKDVKGVYEEVMVERFNDSHNGQPAFTNPAEATDKFTIKSVEGNRDFSYDGKTNWFDHPHEFRSQWPTDRTQHSHAFSVDAHKDGFDIVLDKKAIRTVKVLVDDSQLYWLGPIRK